MNLIPDEPRTGFIHEDDDLWATVAMDTPRGLRPSFRPETPEEAAQEPGCCVKSNETEEGRAMPRFFGKLAQHTPERVIVLGTNVNLPRFIWVGTQPEYERVWRCD